MADGDAAIVGRRTTDGDYLSVREAVRMFASKDEFIAMNTALQGMQATVAQLPTRGEAEKQAKADEQRFEGVRQTAEDTRTELRADLKEVKDDVKALRSNQLPPWTVPVIGAIMALAALVGPHIWR